MVRVVVDTDFLSAFLKTESLDLVRDYFRVEKLILPGAVYREVAVTSLLPRLAATAWLELRRVDREVVEAAATATRSEFADLGAGEREAIALAADLGTAVLLTNDKKALRCAEALDLQAVSIPAFLLLYKSLGEEASGEVSRLVTALEEKDRYAFPAEIRRRLVDDGT